MYRRTFKIVAVDAPKKDGQKEVWPGKSNVGRSASPYRKDGTERKPDELWWPCIPAHPNCCCTWEIRKAVVENKFAAEIQRRGDELLKKRRREDEEFTRVVFSYPGMGVIARKTQGVGQR
jgi:hypothetical protein